jgi:hypothetical protein
MNRLETRLLKLERAAPFTDYPPCAVIRAPFPADDREGWAERLLAELGWLGRGLNVWVVDGPRQEVLLPITEYADLRGDAERVWLEAGTHFPHIMLVTAGGPVVVFYWEDEPALINGLAKLERQLVTEGMGYVA